MPYAVVFGGHDGSLLLELIGLEPGTLFGACVAGVGDIDGDGVDDVAVGAPHDATGGVRAGAVHVFSGRDGTRLFVAHGTRAHGLLGSSLAGVGDVDGDGRRDIAAGSPADVPTAARAGSVFLLSGRDGHAFLELPGSTPGDGFGTSVACLGDVGGDAHVELAVGAPFASDGGRHAGRVDLISLPDGRRLRSLRGLDGERFGASVAVMGDLDLDHVREVLVASPASPGSESVGRVSVISAASGAVLLDLSGAVVGDAFGASLCDAGDVDGDGTRDVLVGSPAANGSGGFRCGRATVFSGQDGSVLLSVDGEASGSGAGRAVAGPGDLDGDGHADLVLGHDGTTRTPSPRGTFWIAQGAAGEPLPEDAGPRR